MESNLPSENPKNPIMKIPQKLGAIGVAFALGSGAAQAVDVLYIQNAAPASPNYQAFIEAKFGTGTWTKATNGTGAGQVGGDLDRVTDFPVVGTHGGTGITVRSYLESFDLIIAGNQVTSTAYLDGVNGGDWAALTKPVLFHAHLAARALGGRPGMFSGDNTISFALDLTAAADTTRLLTTTRADAIFAGVTDETDLYNELILNSVDTISKLGLPGTGGEVISDLTNATAATNAHGIVFWDAGTTNGVGLTLAGKRAFFAMKNTGAPEAFDTLTADGQIVLGNLMDELLVTAPVVFLPPSGLVAKSQSGLSINLTWTASAGAVSYNIKRSETLGGPYTQLTTTPTTVTTNSYTDTGLTEGTTYYYVVTAVNAASTETGNSNEASAPAVTTVLPGIDILFVANGNNPYYENLATNGEFANNTWTQMATGTAGNNLVGGDLSREAEFTGINGTEVGVPIPVSEYLNRFDIVIIGTPTTSGNFIDGSNGEQWANLTVPVLVHSPFAARELGGRLGLFTGDNTVNPFPFVNANETVRVSTSALSDAILAGVTDVTDLYVATQSDTINTAVVSPNAFGNGEEITRLTDGNIQCRGVVFWAAGASLAVSPPTGLPLASNRAFMPFSGGPVDLNADGQRVVANLIKQLQVSQTTPPALLTFPTGLAAVEAGAQIDLTWNESIGATGYNIKRSTTQGTGYVTIASNVATSTYSDTTVTPGTYYYVVSAVSATPAESVDSNEATATIAGGDAYQTWIDTNYIVQLPNAADREADADPDNDGSSNLIEFALNGNPANAADNGAIASLVQDSSAPAGNELTLIAAVRDGATFTAGTATIDGITYSVEGSLDLAFPGSAVSSTGPADTAPPAAGLPDLTGTAWEYHTFKLDASEGLTNKGFLRLKVTQP